MSKLKYVLGNFSEPTYNGPYAIKGCNTFLPDDGIRHFAWGANSNDLGYYNRSEKLHFVNQIFQK